MEQVFKTLNAIYQPIYEYTQCFLKDLKGLGYAFEWNFHNNHYIRKDGEWLVEYYPIPVVTIKNICDIGIDINHIFIESKIKKEKVIELDWKMFSDYRFEVYGADNYLEDFYNSSLSLEALPQKINQSNEKEICVAFYFSYLDDKHVLLDMIKKLDAMCTL